MAYNKIFGRQYSSNNTQIITKNDTPQTLLVVNTANRNQSDCIHTDKKPAKPRVNFGG